MKKNEQMTRKFSFLVFSNSNWLARLTRRANCYPILTFVDVRLGPGTSWQHFGLDLMSCSTQVIGWVLVIRFATVWEGYKLSLTSAIELLITITVSNMILL